MMLVTFRGTCRSVGDSGYKCGVLVHLLPVLGVHRRNDLLCPERDMSSKLDAQHIPGSEGVRLHTLHATVTERLRSALL